jgi:hypothetical protein
MMYDRNGLRLSPMAETNNAYYHTAVDTSTNKYSAYARAEVTEGRGQWSMYRIGKLYTDSRHAAFVAQEFEKTYSQRSTRMMVNEGTFSDCADKFVEGIDIPEWQYPAEGLSAEDVAIGYKRNYIPGAREALIEVISVFGLQPPPIVSIKGLVNEVEMQYKLGITYREAARNIMKVRNENV